MPMPDHLDFLKFDPTKEDKQQPLRIIKNKCGFSIDSKLIKKA